MFIALDKLANQNVRQAVICVPGRSIGASFGSEPLSKFGFFTDWNVAPQWNLCNTPRADDPKVAKSKVKAVGEFLASDEKLLICTHATFRFAFDELGPEAFDDRLVAIDEFHQVSADAGNRLGAQLAQLTGRNKAHVVAMTGSYSRGDAIPVLAPEDEAKFETVKPANPSRRADARNGVAQDFAFHQSSSCDRLKSILWSFRRGSNRQAISGRQKPGRSPAA